MRLKLAHVTLLFIRLSDDCRFFFTFILVVFFVLVIIVVRVVRRRPKTVPILEPIDKAGSS
jgi:type II secretory pathway component PulF